MLWRTFCRMGQRVMVASKVKSKKDGAVAKASLKRATKFVAVDPKLSDLSMARVNSR